MFTFGGDVIKKANIRYDNPDELLLSDLSYVPVYLFSFHREKGYMNYTEFETLKEHIHIVYLQETY